MAANITNSKSNSTPMFFEVMPLRNHSIKDTVTLLYGAILRGSLDQVKELIQDLKSQGGSLDCDVIQGNTFLHIAAKVGHVEIAMELIDQGASLNPLNKDGRTPLEMGLIYEHEEVAGILLSCGGTRESVDRKILAHIWGIKGKMKLNEENQKSPPGTKLKSKKVKYEGLPSKLTEVPFINYTTSFFKSKEFKEMNSRLNPEPLLDAVQKIPENKTRPPEEIAKEVLEGTLVLEHTGWTGHATGVGFSKEIVVKTNCARRKDLGQKQPVSKFYVMKKTDQLGECIAGMQKMDSKVFFNKTIDELLGLVSLDELIKSAQKGGHCSWASLKALFHAALELECAKIYPDQKEAKQEAYRIYKAWKYFVSHVALRTYLATSPDRDHSLISQIQEKNKERELKSKYWGIHVFQ